MPIRTQDQTVLITGATSGIGLALARVFAREGHPVILHGRDADKLWSVQQELQSISSQFVQTVCQDLAHVDAASRILDQVQKQKLTVDILVNNAGFGDRGEFVSASETKLEEMLKVNIVALTALTRALLPPMLARGQGKILNVASTAAFLPGPMMAVYYASKAYVLSFSEALSEELRDHHIQVTVLCPGPTATHFAERAGVSKVRMFSGPLVQSPEAVAEYAYRALMVGEVVAISGWWNRLYVWLTRFVPRFVVRRVMGRVGGK